MLNITIYDNHMVAGDPEVLNHIYFIMIDTKKCRMLCISMNSVGHVSKVSFLLTIISIRRISEECWVSDTCQTRSHHCVFSDRVSQCMTAKSVDTRVSLLLASCNKSYWAQWRAPVSLYYFLLKCNWNSSYQCMPISQIEDFKICKIEIEATEIINFIPENRNWLFNMLLKVSQDVPKYMMVSGERADLRGLNLEGLRRRGFSDSEVGFS